MYFIVYAAFVRIKLMMMMITRQCWLLKNSLIMKENFLKFRAVTYLSGQ